MIYTVCGILFMLLLFVFVYTRQPKNNRVSLFTCLIAALLGGIPGFFIAFYFQIFVSAYFIRYISDPTIRSLVENFLIIALSEEMLKYLSAIIASRKKSLSRSNYIAVFAAAGLGFEIMESSMQMSDALSMIVRCVLAIHIALQICMGSLYSKNHKVLACLVPILIHGAYDYGLGSSFKGLIINSSGDDALLVLGVAVGGICFLIWSLIHANSVGKQESKESIKEM